MTDITDRRFQLAAARADFLEGQDDPGRSAVPDHVVASWRRSISRGVQPSVVESPYFSELDFGSRLVRCAEPVMDQLVEQLGVIPMCVALTDGDARILVRKDGSPSIARVADRHSFAQGFGYAERSVGTNGVGTVLESGRSVEIFSAEHFVESLQPFACTGAPVRDPFTGRIEGVLDISCYAEHSSPILHSLVRSAAARIEHNLVADRNQAQQALFDVYSRADARSRDAVLAVGPRIVMANTQAQTALVQTDQAALHDHVRFLMVRHAGVDDRIDLPSGARVRLRGSTVTVGDEVAGMVCLVTVLDEPGTASAEGPRPSGPTRTPPRIVDSGSPAWCAATAAAGAALDRGEPVLVLGEPGSGRSALLRERFRSKHPQGEVVAIPAQEVTDDPRGVAARLAAPPATPTLHVLQEIERVPGTAMGELVGALRAVGAGIGALGATSSGTATFGASHQALLGLFATSVVVPPLRHRGTDLPTLTATLLAELVPHREVHLSREAQRVVAGYHWPGNIRQLRDALAEALRARPVGVIEATDLPAYCQSAPRSSLRPVDQVERDAIVAALREASGNRKAAAAALGLARSTLYRKIRQYGISG